MLPPGTVIYCLQFHRHIRLIAFDYLQRFANFIIKLDRIICYCSLVANTVFGMLEIRAEYSLTSPSVYRMVATRSIERTKKLNISSYVTHSAAIDTTYPSWDAAVEHADEMCPSFYCISEPRVPSFIRYGTYTPHLI